MSETTLRADVYGAHVRCQTCAKSKKPVGRDAAIGGPDYCDDECPGYRQRPFPGSLWPNESEATFGYPVSDTGTTADPDQWRMDAYYYSFERTGVEAIDRILSAVACAGKAYHHTEEWNQDSSPRVHLRGSSPVKWIQNAANDAASALANGASSDGRLKK